MGQLKKKSKTAGYTLLVLTVLLMLGGFALSQTAASGLLQHKLALQQQSRETQILDHIRANLFGFAGSQGIHSQSHLGHLPCPADAINAEPKTTCLQKPWGYLPVQSKTSINYLNQGINARNNELEPSARQHWQYAVSAQLLQPNALGWSRWVDYSKPAMRIRIPSENNYTEDNVAAVVAKSIQLTAEHHYDIAPPYIVISVRELRAHMAQVQLHLIKDTLQTWLQEANPRSGALVHENMAPASDVSSYIPVNSDCSCRCTRTRCACNCAGEGKWISQDSCFGANPLCIEEEHETACTSNPEEPCLFNGPASLESRWPISRFEPVAASNKSCRPLQRNECPLSTNTVACVCDFSWPDSTKPDLSGFFITQLPSNGVVVKQVQQ